MSVLCLLCLYASFTSAVEYTFQQPELPDFFAKPKFHKTVKTYYYKTPPQYQVQYERVKVPMRRPHTFYVPKPYFVKTQATQQYFEKHPPYSYRIERPPQQLYFEHKLPLDSKFLQDVKVPVNNQVSVTVEKPLLLPDVEKPIVEKTPEEPFEGYFSLPEGTPQFEVKKESSFFPGFDKELFAQQISGGSVFSSDSAQGKHQHVSFPSELHQSWSPQSKVVLEPIVVSEEPKKVKNLSTLSEWVPRYEISDLKTVSSDQYHSPIPQRQKFELSEVKIPLHESHLSDELSKNNFASFPTVENVTYHSVGYFEIPKNYPESSSSNKNELFHISSGQLIKPEALTSSASFQNFNYDQKSTVDSSEKWMTGQEQYATPNEPPLRWDKGQQDFALNQNEPNKDWPKSQVKYTIKSEPTNNLVGNLQQQYTIQYEPSKKLTKNQEEYLAQNKAATKNWLKGHEQYTSQKQPEQQWLKTEGQYISQKEPTHEWFKTQGQVNRQQYVQPQFSLQEVQSSRSKPEQQATQSVALSTQHFSMSPQYEFNTKEALQPQSSLQEVQSSRSKPEQQAAQSVALSTQHFSMSPQYEFNTKEALQPQSSLQNSQQEKQYFTFSPQFESNFKPLIPVQGHTTYKRPAETNEQSSQNSHPQVQNYVLQNQLQDQQPIHHQHVQQQQQQNRQHLQYFYHPQSSPVQLENHQKQEMAPLVHGHSPQNDLQQQTQHTQEAKSHISYQQYFPETQQSQEAPQPQYTVEPHQYHSSRDKHGYWHHGPQHEAIKEKTTPEVTDRPESPDQQQTKTESVGGDAFGQKSRRLRHPMSAQVTDQLVRLARVTTTATTVDPPSTTASTSTTSHLRKKHRRKHRRRNNQEATTQLPEQ